MSLTNQYLILNGDLKRIGTLTIDGATLFSNDNITMELANSDETSSSVNDETNIGSTDTMTGTIDLNAQSKNYDHSGTIDVMQGQPDSNKVVGGNCLAYYDAVAGHWYVMYIYSTKTSATASGRHVTTAYLTNLMLYNLATHYPLKKELKGLTADLAFKYLFQNTGWEINNTVTNMEVKDTSVSGSQKASVLLQDMLQAYDAEVDAYVVVDSQGNVIKRQCDIMDELNSEVVFNEAVFGRNITAISRTAMNTPITKLYVFGASGGSISDMNGGKPYLVDDAANEMYNPDYKQGTYLEGAITANNINAAPGLLAWGKMMLKLFNHPRIFYEVNVTPDFNPPLGATIRFKDEQMEPVLDATGRVIQRTFSFANPWGNTVGFGEYTTVIATTPSWLTIELEALRKAVASAKNDPSLIDINVLYPDGTTIGNGTSTKRLIMQVIVSGENISSFMADQGFIWKHLTQAGYQDNWSANGYLTKVNSSQVGIVRGRADNDYLQDDSEVDLNMNQAKLIGTFPTKQGGLTMHAAQYIVQLSDGGYISSHHWGSDVWFLHWDSNFKLINKMIATNAGHGGSFGVEYVNGVANIWSAMKNSDGWYVARYPYVSGTLDPKSITYCIPTDGQVRVNYDFNHDAVGYSTSNGIYKVYDKSAVLDGDNIPSYSIDLLKGHGFDGVSQTYQSQALDFPYLYFHSGNVDMKDDRMVYGVNLIHQGDEFRKYYDFNNSFIIGNAVREPESLSIVNNSDGSKSALVSFNTLPSTSSTSIDGTEYVFLVPIEFRGAVPDIDAGDTGFDRSQEVD